MYMNAVEFKAAAKSAYELVNEYKDIFPKQ